MQFHGYSAHAVSLASGALVTALLDQLVAHQTMPPRQARAIIRNAANNLGAYTTEDARNATALLMQMLARYSDGEAKKD
jgi:hypothetical protein